MFVLEFRFAAKDRVELCGRNVFVNGLGKDELLAGERVDEGVDDFEESPYKPGDINDEGLSKTLRVVSLEDV